MLAGTASELEALELIYAGRDELAVRAVGEAKRQVMSLHDRYASAIPALLEKSAAQDIRELGDRMCAIGAESNSANALESLKHHAGGFDFFVMNHGVMIGASGEFLFQRTY